MIKRGKDKENNVYSNRTINITDCQIECRHTMRKHVRDWNSFASLNIKNMKARCEVFRLCSLLLTCYIYIYETKETTAVS